MQMPGSPMAPDISKAKRITRFVCLPLIPVFFILGTSFGIYDKPKTEPQPQLSFTESLWVNVKTIFWALVFALGFQTVAYQPFVIPSESMLPNLLVGDYIFVSKFSYGYGKYSAPVPLPFMEGNRLLADIPKRGDVAVFRYPQNTSISYIKRIIGLPGDHIQVISGTLYINGQEMPRVKLDNWYPPFEPKSGNGFEHFRETLDNGKSFTILEKDNNYGELDTTDVFIVPEGHFFAMGDNRDRSKDSRAKDVGFVSMDNLAGRAELIFFSLGGGAKFWELWKYPTNLRYSRMFTTIK